MRIGIGRKTSLDWFEVDESGGFVSRTGGEEEGRGEAGGN